LPFDLQGNRQNDWVLPGNVANALGEINELGQKKTVYFNSNEYHGNQFITEEAVNIGYKNEPVARDAGILQKGIGSMVQVNEDIMAISAEDALLRTLLLSAVARKSMKSTIDISHASGSEEEVEWSSAEKSWLFSCLVNQHDEIPSFGPRDLFEFRSYLANRSDVFPGALSLLVSEDNGSSQNESVGQSRDSKTSEGSVGSNSNLEKRTGKTSSVTFDTFSDPEDIERWAAAADPSILNDETDFPDKDTEYTFENKEAVPSTTGGSQNQTDLTIEKSEGVEPMAASIEPRAMAEDESLNMVGNKKVDYINAEFVVSEPFDQRYTGQGSGSLDYLFASELDLPISSSSDHDSAPPDERAELAVQELYSTLQWTSAVKWLSQKREQLVSVASLVLKNGNETSDSSTDGLMIEARNEQEKEHVGKHLESVLIVHLNKTLSHQELAEYSISLTTEVRDATEKVRNLADASHRMTTRLMDYAMTSGLSEGRISKSEYQNLNQQLRSHMGELEKWSVPETQEANSNDDEAYEDLLERAQMEWGELYEDDRMWSPDDIVGSQIVGEDFDTDHLSAEASSDDEESIDDFMLRMDSEWGWLQEADTSAEQLAREPYRYETSALNDLLNSSNGES
jgi:hypothetical protein